MNLPLVVFRALFLIGFLPLATGLYAQVDLEKSLRNFRKADCIDKATASSLEARVASGEIDGPIALIDEICEAELQALAGKRYDPEMLDGIGLAELDLDQITQKLSKATLNKMLNLCTKNGFIDEKSRTSLRHLVEQAEVDSKVSLMLAVRRELLYREAVSPLKLQGLAQQLRANGLVSPGQSTKLIRAIDDRVITDPFEMLDYCNNARRFDATDYSLDAQEYVRKIHDQTADLLPELKIKKLTYDIMPGPGGFADPVLMVSMEMGGFSYWEAGSLVTQEKQKKTFRGRLKPGSYYKIFNKALAEQGSLYRLHLVTCNLDDDLGMGPMRRFGIIALRESQPEAFRYLGSYYTFSKEDFRNALSRELVDGVIDRYFSFGLFSSLTANEYRESREFALSNPRLSYEEVLNCFPRTFYEVRTTRIERGSYGDLLQNLAAISRGRFNPTNVQMGPRFSFKFGGDTWSAELQPFVSKPDPAFFALLDQAVATLPEGRFYQITGKEKYIFLNTEQWDLLHRQKVVGKQK